MQDDKLKNEDPKSIKIKHYVPEGMMGVYSDGAQVMHTPNEFVLSFFQIEHPPIDPDAGALTEVKSQCVARIFLSPDHMSKLVSILNENFAAYRRSIERSRDEHE